MTHDARHHDHAHVEVFALDALARIAAEAGDLATAGRLCQAADRRMAAVAHFITDLDRTDAHRNQATRRCVTLASAGTCARRA